jgi:hypothetical protein
MARYPENAESKFFELEKLSPSIESYNQFKLTLRTILDDKSSDYLKVSQDFLQKVYTKNQIARLNLILKSNN